MDNAVLISVLVLLSTIAWLCGYDFYAYRRWGNSSTFSWILLNVLARIPIFCLPLSYTFGLLEGHLCLPSDAAEPPTWEVICRLLAASSPIFAGLAAIVWHPEASACSLQWLNANRWRIAGGLIAGNAVGILLGAVLVPQHLG